MPLGVGHFLRRTDLVGVEVVEPGFSFRQFGVAVDTGQQCVAAGFVEIQAVELWLLFLEQAQALPEEPSLPRLVILRDLFANTPSQGVVVVMGLAAQGRALPSLRTDKPVFAVVVKVPLSAQISNLVCIKGDEKIRKRPAFRFFGQAMAA